MTDEERISDEVEALLEMAQSEPIQALTVGIELLGTVEKDNHASRSAIYRALGVAARNGSDVSGSIDYGENAIREADLAGDLRLRSLSLMSLAGSRTFMGENTRALEMLDAAAVGAESLLLAEIEFQRGTIFARMGEPDKAMSRYSAALPEFERLGDRHSVAMTLHNRAMVEVSLGDIGQAESDLVRAKSLSKGPFLLAGVEHGLGVVASIRGDIPLALSRFDASKAIFTEVAESAYESQVSRCEVLMSAGLFREALQLAETVTDEMRRVGLGEEEAEARLVAAQAALLSEDFDRATSWAEQAAQMFSEQDRVAWAANARLVGLQVRYESGSDESRLLNDARDVARVLKSHGQVLGERRARLLAGLIGARYERGDGGLTDLAWVAGHTTGPIETQVQSRLAKAVICQVQGNMRGADAAARAGLRLLDQYQAAIGATDVRVGIDRHGKALGDFGLSLARTSRRARRVFRWVELRRGRALLHRPVVPPQDEDLAAVLSELRLVSNELRTAEGAEAATLVRKQSHLQNEIRNRARLARGGGRSLTPTGLADLIEKLGDTTMIQYGSLGDVSWAITVRRGRVRMAELGDRKAAQHEAESLRFLMRRLARRGGPHEAARQVANRIDDLLLAPLRLKDGPVVIVPTPGLHAMPWWAFPSLQDRPLSVSPSAGLWIRAGAQNRRGTNVLLVAGPDLNMSDAEVTELSGLHPTASAIRSKDSSVESIVAGLDGAGIAHIACHASFQFENPMFSSLRLADGDLYVYDIERLETGPDIVVLSACDSGFTDTHPGEELMGLSSALLSMGTRSIIASVGLVPDSHATKDLMVELHRRLVAGLSPSVALHQAQRTVSGTPEGYIAASSFVCIGAG